MQNKEIFKKKKKRNSAAARLFRVKNSFAIGGKFGGITVAMPKSKCHCGKEFLSGCVRSKRSRENRKNEVIVQETAAKDRNFSKDLNGSFC